MQTATFLRALVWLLLCVSLLSCAPLNAPPPAPSAPLPPAPTAPSAPAPSAALPPGRWISWSTPALTVPGPLYAVTTAAVNDAWAVGAAGTVYHYNGQTWLAVSSTVTESLESVYAVGANTALVVGAASPDDNRPAVLTCTPAGCSQDNTVPPVGSLDSIWAVSPTDYWAAGGGGLPGSEFGTIVHFAGGWSANLATGAAAGVHLHNIQMLSAAEGWAVGDSTTVDGPGTLLHYTSGAGWQGVNTSIAFTGSLRGLWFISATEGWVVGGPLGPSPVILHYQASATPQWTREIVTQLGAPETMLWYVDMRPDGSGYAAGNDGQILARDPTLGTWQSVFTDFRPPQAPFYGVWLAPTGTLGWAVGGVDGPDTGIFARYSPPAVAWLPLVAR
jgi:hypothetical protein